MNALPVTSLLAHRIGVFAHDLLTQKGCGRVMGTTARGIFVQTPANRVVFISSVPVPGPLTIQVRGSQPDAQRLSQEEKIEISSHTLTFTESRLKLDFGRATIWTPSPHSPVDRTFADRQSHLLAVMDGLKNSGRQSEFFSSFLQLLNVKEKVLPLALPEIVQQLHLLQVALRAHDESCVLESLPRFLGHGAGLTPAGDDFIWGFLLALNRWQDVLSPSFDLKRLNAAVIEQAERGTTCLSLTLMEAACHGWTDANLLKVLDSIFVGGISVTECVQLILAYGNTSGLEAWAGMAMASLP